MVLEDGEDVVVASDDPEVELGRVEDRLLTPSAVEDRERILALRRVERIERDAADLLLLVPGPGDKQALEADERVEERHAEHTQQHHRAERQ